MLTLKHRFHLPAIAFESHAPLEFAPVPVDDGDELTQAITADPVDHDDNWSLDERPDTQELESFWSEVSDDLKQDPEWVQFSNNNGA